MEIPKASSNAEDCVLKTVRQRCLLMKKTRNVVSTICPLSACLSLAPLVTLQVLYLWNESRVPQEHADISLKEKQLKVLGFFFFQIHLLMDRFLGLYLNFLVQGPIFKDAQWPTTLSLSAFLLRAVLKEGFSDVYLAFNKKHLFI